MDLVFYGDSILKLWKDSLPVSNKTSNVQSDVFTRNFGSYSAAVAGGSGQFLCPLLSELIVRAQASGRPDHAPVVSGDQTDNLMWRLRHGESFHKNPPKVTIVMIGTNDLSAVGCRAGESGITAAAGGVFSRWCLTSIHAQQMVAPSTTSV